MSWWRRILGVEDGGGSPGGGRAASAAVRAIAARLADLDSETAHYLAAFASVLARVADADLSIDDDEKREMCARVAALAGLEPEAAELVVELAAERANDHGGSDRYVVTREFRGLSTREQRIHAVECLFAVAAADGTISSVESNEALAIAEELGLTRAEALGLRAGWREHLAELRPMPAETTGPEPG